MVGRSDGPLLEPYFASREQLDAYASLGARSVGRTKLGLAHFRRDEPGLGFTLPNPRRDLIMATVNLRPLGDRGQMWCDDRAFERGPLAHGDLVILDQRMSWASVVLEPFEMMQLFIPVDALDALADELGAAPVATLDCPVTAPRRDPVMVHLALALRPVLRRPNEVSNLFADHMLNAMLVHLARRYGGLKPGRRPRGGLAAWQLRRVTEVMLDDPGRDSTLGQLASLCGLSPTHFGRAFKISTGQSPHRWLLFQRVERARQLLEFSTRSVSEIALACGFADQSHLTRVFHRVVGASPAAWRRRRRS